MMKKCPKCHAEIEDNARFCLYCMTSFEEKEAVEFPAEKRKWPVTLIAGILAVLLLCGGLVYLLIGGDATSDGNISATADTTHSQGSTTVTRGASSTKENSPLPSSDPSQEGTFHGGITSASSHTTASKGTTRQASHTTGTTTTSIPTSTATTTTVQAVTSRYSYTAATAENVYPPGDAPYHQTYADIIVITKVNYVEPSGHYVIPETIDGKKVGAIMPGAFSAPAVCGTVRSVALPAGVRTIWNDAFGGCVNLQELYLKTIRVGIYTDAFPPLSERKASLTFHANRECMGFDFYYYRNVADRYGATFQEWNG